MTKMLRYCGNRKKESMNLKEIEEYEINSRTMFLKPVIHKGKRSTLYCRSLWQISVSLNA